MKMKRVLLLEDAALDWAVATCDKLPIVADPMAFGIKSANGGYWVWNNFPGGDCQRIGHEYSPSTNWKQGGPIIDRLFKETASASGGTTEEGLVIFWIRDENGDKYTRAGPTLLIAAMRCYVTSKLGDEIEIPEELL